jgi:Tfp pilus assembly protein PilO
MATLLHSASRIAASSSRAEASRTRVRLKAAFAVLMALTAILLLFLFRSSGRTAAERQDEVTRLDAKQRLAQSRIEQLRALKQRVQDATQNEQRFAQGNFLPRSSAFSQMLSDLEKLATANKLQPSDISYRLNEKDNKLGWTNVGVSLQIEGDYSSLVRFLNQLEQSKLFWIIEGLEVSGQLGEHLRLTMQASTYLLPS